MSAIHESTKTLVRQAMSLFREAVQEGRIERANELQNRLLEVLDNTIDDNANLSQVQVRHQGGD